MRPFRVRLQRLFRGSLYQMMWSGALDHRIQKIFVCDRRAMDFVDEAFENVALFCRPVVKFVPVRGSWKRKS